MRFNGLLDVLAYTTARKHIYKEKKAVVLKNADLLLGSVDGILDHDTINTFRKKELFFDR